MERLHRLSQAGVRRGKDYRVRGNKISKKSDEGREAEPNKRDKSDLKGVVAHYFCFVCIWITLKRQSIEWLPN